MSCETLEAFTMFLKVFGVRQGVCFWGKVFEGKANKKLAVGSVKMPQH